jgi:nickel/cobalt transporter (NiCoT) family protein
LAIQDTYRALRRQKRDPASSETVSPIVGQGIVSRLLRPLMKTLAKPIHMYPIGFLFGLGFETATEIALLQVSASSGAKGQSLMNVMVLPVLFAAGMTLVDSADGMIMAGAYNWAFINPIRKLYYNLTITFVSVVVGVVVGGIELIGLAKDKLNLDGGWFWFTIGVLQDNFGAIGLAIVGVFILTWLISAILYRLKKLNFPE